jgi:hypothetical protein
VGVRAADLRLDISSLNAKRTARMSVCKVFASNMAEPYPESALVSEIACTRGNADMHFGRISGSLWIWRAVLFIGKQYSNMRVAPVG